MKMKFLPNILLTLSTFQLLEAASPKKLKNYIVVYRESESQEFKQMASSLESKIIQEGGKIEHKYNMPGFHGLSATIPDNVLKEIKEPGNQYQGIINYIEDDKEVKIRKKPNPKKQSDF